ncbi:MAG: twin-arginine translocation pathway signal protein [Chloroflexi bacterium]|nr:twin-arginine translocation pathway signal protein [Chloroflexota bacterium]
MQFAPRKLLLLLLIAMLSLGVMVSAQDGEVIPTITVHSVTQAERPVEFEATRLLVENMRQLGLDVEHRAIPWAQVIDEVWFTREGEEAWQMTAWRMVGRPERSDPDEFAYNLFHSSGTEAGFNFPGYVNPEYDALAEAQRTELDPEARRDIIFEAQRIIAEDVPNIYYVHPSTPQLVRNDVWDVSTVVEQSGIGIHNFWTWTQLTPIGDQADIITSTTSFLEAFNPLYIAGDAPSRVTELVWDRLMRIGPDGLPQLWAAESVEWEDNINVVITLREGMTWHDGTPVTVEDAVYSFEAILSDEAPMYTPFVSGVDTIEVIDELSMRITLFEPSAAFETSTLAKLNLIPKHIWEPYINEVMTQDEVNAEDIQEEIPIGSGPYRMVAYDVNEFVILERFDDHFAPPAAERWIMNVLPNQEATLGQIQTGEMNFLWEWAGDSEILALIAESDPNLELFASPSMGFQYFAFNLRMEPFSDPAFRRAIAHLVPRETIINNIYKGFGIEATSYVATPFEFWHNPALPEYEFSIERAQEVLAEAGYTLNADGRLLYPAN